MKFPRSLGLFSAAVAAIGMSCAHLAGTSPSVERAFAASEEEFPGDVLSSSEPAAEATGSPEAKPSSKPEAKPSSKPEAKPSSKSEAKPRTVKKAKASENSKPKPRDTFRSQPELPNVISTDEAELKKVGTGPDAASKDELSSLRQLDVRYRNSTSVSMDVDKTLVIGALGTKKKSRGKLLLSKGRMRMEIEEPAKSLVVIDGKTIWVADYPPADLKEAPVQVLTGSIGSAKGAGQSFVGILTRGGLLKHFKVTAVQKDSGDREVYFMQPAKPSGEFKRAQMTLSADKKYIAELKYWDAADNETHYVFSNVNFDKPLPAKAFEFAPPAKAEVTSI